MRRRHTRAPTSVSTGVIRWGLVVVALWGLGPSALHGQLSVLQMELNAGASVPVGTFAGAQGWEAEASSDASFGVHFALTSGHLGYRVGFSEHRFTCSPAGCGEETNLVSTAWDVGVRVNLRTSGVVPWLQIGVIAALVEADLATLDSGGASTTERRESDRGWGYEVGGGLLIPLASRFGVNPGVRYGRVDPEFESRGVLRERYLVVDIGFVLGF